MHLPAEMDGGPHQTIAPGEPLGAGVAGRPAGRHALVPPAPARRTQEHVYRGLAGMFLIDDARGADAPALRRPTASTTCRSSSRTRRFDDDGELVVDDGATRSACLGDVVLVNGTAGGGSPASPPSRVRMRLLNGSTARTYHLGLADRRPVRARRHRRRACSTAPVTVDDGAAVTGRAGRARGRVRARRDGASADASSRARNVVVPTGARRRPTPLDLVEFRADRQPGRAPRRPCRGWPGSTGSTPSRPPGPHVRARRREINGRRMDLDRIDAVAAVGDLERWTVRSRNPFPHNFHVHDVQFQVLEVDGKRPRPQLAGRKDTIYLEPHVTVRPADALRRLRRPRPGRTCTTATCCCTRTTA